MAMANKRVKEMVNTLLAEYRDSEVCMAEFLASKFVRNYSFEEAFEIYVECMKVVEGDKFFVEKEGNLEQL